MQRESFDVEDRQAWARLRGRKDLTGSRMAVLFNDHPYLKVDRVAYEFRHGPLPHQDNVAALRTGRILEAAFPVAIKEKEPKWRLEKVHTYHRLPEFRIGAIPDFWLDDDGLIEAVTVGEDEWRSRPGPPRYKIWQCATEMLVTGKMRGYVAVLVKDRAYTLPLFLFEVPDVEKLQARILDSTQKWWKAMEAQTEHTDFPLPLGHQADLSAVVASKLQRRPVLQTVGPVLRF